MKPYMLHYYTIARYAGRPPAAATATGNKTMHQSEQMTLLQEALQL